MRGMILIGCVVAVTGCRNAQTAHSDSCPSCNSWKSMSMPAAPTVREVRGEEAVPTSAVASNPTQQSNVVLVPRWVYVPYTPSASVTPSPLPESVQSPQVNRVPSEPVTSPSRSEMIEQCLKEIQSLNQRMSELESKSEIKPTSSPTSASMLPNPPQMLPLPPLSIPLLPGMK